MHAAVISKLRPGSQFILDGDTLTFLDDTKPPTEKEIVAATADYAAELEATAYRERRRAEYPSIGDQLDDLFKQGVFSEEMAAKIQAVKDKYPKPA